MPAKRTKKSITHSPAQLFAIQRNEAKRLTAELKGLTLYLRDSAHFIFSAEERKYLNTQSVALSAILNNWESTTEQIKRINKMPDEQNDQALRDELTKLRTMYTADISQGTFNALVIGLKGIGKSQLYTTCPKPVLIDSFDPGGTKHLAEEINRGEVVVDTRWEGLMCTDGKRDRQAFDLWEEVFLQRKNSGFFKLFGTYGIDSYTSWIRSMYHSVGSGKFASDGVPEFKGWAVIGNTAQDYLRLCTALPCNFLITGHITKEKDEVSGKIMSTISTIPSLQISVPLLFDEYYTMQIDPADQKKRVLLTGNTDRQAAGTRLGRKGKFELYEKPDIKYLMNKAGLSTDDKPLFMEASK